MRGRAGLTGPVLFLLFLGCFRQAEAGGRGRLFGDFALGAGYDDSIFRDATGKASATLPEHAGIGWKGRFSPETTSRLYYRLSYQGYAEVPRESYFAHEAEGSLRHRLHRSLYATLDLAGTLLRQSRLDAFDINRAFYRPGLEYRFLSGTLVRGALLYEREDYPHFDLDTRGPGFEFQWVQDLTLYGTLRARYNELHKNFGERRLFLNPAGALSADRREDADRNWIVSLEGDWRPAGLRGGYEWFERRSNGNLIDYGPNQSASNNPAATDDRLIGDAYSYQARGPFVAIDVRAIDDYLLSLSTRWQNIDFAGRLAKNDADQFAPGEPTRQETRNQTLLSLTRFYTLRRLTLGWTAGLSREQSDSNDTLYDFTNHRGFLVFRGWF